MTPQRREQLGESPLGCLSQALAAKVGPDRFDVWFRRSCLVESVENELRVSAASQFVIDSIRRLFDPILKELAQERGLSGLSYAVSKPSQFGAAQSTSQSATQAASNASVPVAASNASPLAVAAGGYKTASSNENGAAARPNGTRRPIALPQIISGPHNQMAFAAALQVAQNPGSCSPLYIYGPTGSGKTWMMRAIHQAVSERREFRSLSISAEQFTTGFLEALQRTGMPNFRAKHRDVDFLLLDDVHFLAGKRATIVELIATIDSLGASGKQMIFTSTRPPSELMELGAELSARLGSGLVCPVEYAFGDSKRLLIEQLARQKQLELPHETVSMMAEELPGDARQLSGAIHRLVGLKLAGVEVRSTDEARRYLDDLVQISAPSIGMDEIENAVCETFGIDRDQLRSASKNRQFSQPRMLAMWLARRKTRAALSEIGEYFGGRRHSTVATAQRTVDQWLKADRLVGSSRRSLKISDAVRRIERRLSCG